MAIVLHIARRADWYQAVPSGEYAADSLRTQGFIHCSTARQVIAVANYLFRGQTDLVLLRTDTDAIDAEVKYENLEGGTQLFPHIYGPIPVKAVTHVSNFPPGTDGTFALPPEIA